MPRTKSTKRKKAPKPVSIVTTLHVTTMSDGATHLDFQSPSALVHICLPKGLSLFAEVIEMIPLLGKFITPQGTVSAEGPAPSDQDQRAELLAAMCRRDQPTTLPPDRPDVDAPLPDRPAMDAPARLGRPKGRKTKRTVKASTGA